MTAVGFFQDITKCGYVHSYTVIAMWYIAKLELFPIIAIVHLLVCLNRNCSVVSTVKLLKLALWNRNYVIFRWFFYCTIFFSFSFLSINLSLTVRRLQWFVISVNRHVLSSFHSFQTFTPIQENRSSIAVDFWFLNFTALKGVDGGSHRVPVSLSLLLLLSFPSGYLLIYFCISKFEGVYGSCC